MRRKDESETLYRDKDEKTRSTRKIGEHREEKEEPGTLQQQKCQEPRTKRYKRKMGLSTIVDDGHFHLCRLRIQVYNKTSHLRYLNRYFTKKKYPQGT